MASEVMPSPNDEADQLAAEAEALADKVRAYTNANPTADCGMFAETVVRAFLGQLYSSYGDEVDLLKQVIANYERDAE